MFRTVSFDIVGGCNAKCPFCVTARTTFGQRIQHISVPDFARSLDRLLDLNLVEQKKTTIMLFNWGEPMLHPKLNDIVQEAYRRKLRVGISTNGSKKTSFTGTTSHFDTFIFSMPGWSQASYDKIHDLKFDRVVANIEASIKNLRETGYYGHIRVSFHVYKFNIKEELPRAREWCLKHGVVLDAYSAYINDYEVMLKYRQGTLPAEEMAEINDRMFLDYVDDVVEARAKDWTCPQWDTKLTLNHRSEVLLCCVVPQGHDAYAIGSLFDLSREQILKGKTGNKECDTCIQSGVASWAHSPKQFGGQMKPPRSIQHKIGRMRQKIDQMLWPLPSA